MSLLLVSALICVFHLIVISCQRVFTNVAFSKPVTLSSVYSGHYSYFPGPNAVNGLLSDFVHTYNEKFPWLRIDLGARYRIHEIELFARSDCCSNRLHDVEFKVGETVHHMDFCGHFTGHAFTGQRIAVYCPHKTIGRYVQLKIVRGSVNQMTPAEVLVWGVRVRR